MQNEKVRPGHRFPRNSGRVSRLVTLERWLPGELHKFVVSHIKSCHLTNQVPQVTRGRQLGGDFPVFFNQQSVSGCHKSALFPQALPAGWPAVLVWSAPPSRAAVSWCYNAQIFPPHGCALLACLLLSVDQDEQLGLVRLDKMLTTRQRTEKP